ncbi:MAG: DNA helicase UvrBC [Gemmataceae bacterium]
MQKCQRCQNPAYTHIVEVQGEEQFLELHLCTQCATEYLSKTRPGDGPEKAGGEAELDLGEAFSNAEPCPQCGLKLQDFRATGRLGCAYDYEVFREDLKRLLQHIHGDVSHAGKTPRRRNVSQDWIQELGRLRKLLQQAVNEEKYEEAARLRDRIRELERH